MKDLIRAILIEFKERELPKPSPRNIRPPELPLAVRKAWVLMGMRRSGKTWTAYQHILERQKQGFAKSSNLYINFEDDRLADFQAHHFQTILDVYYELYPEYIDSKDLFFCFDEIHVIEGWEKFIRRLIDSETMQVAVTGSSAEMLSRELGTSLGGRAWEQEIFPYSFHEFLTLKGLDPSKEWSPKTESLIKSLATEYMTYGGFPEVVASPRELHTSLIQGYMDAVILRDIVKRYSLGNADIIQKFFIQVLRQLGSCLSVTKVHGTMKSLGLSIGKNSLFEYLQYFEDAYAILTAPFFSLSEKVRQVNPKKVYAVDPGVITAYSIKTNFESAARLENSVFMHLRRNFKNICYYKTELRKKEIDFVVSTMSGKLLLFQACFDIKNPETRERELSALYEACEEFDLREGIIVTEDHEEEIIYYGILIRCIPFWKWSLTIPESN